MKMSTSQDVTGGDHVGSNEMHTISSISSMYSAQGFDPWAQLSFRESDLPDQVTSLIGYSVNVCELDSLGRNCR